MNISKVEKEGGGGGGGDREDEREKEIRKLEAYRQKRRSTGVVLQ